MLKEKKLNANHKQIPPQPRVDLFLLLHLFVDTSYILWKRYYPWAVSMFIVVPDNKFDHISWNFWKFRIHNAGVASTSEIITYQGFVIDRQNVFHVTLCCFFEYLQQKFLRTPCMLSSFRRCARRLMRLRVLITTSSKPLFPLEQICRAISLPMSKSVYSNPCVS